MPAHNEGAVIARTLKAMITGAACGELDIIVICNGCRDDTAHVARQFDPFVRVIELDVASKPAALNVGDQAARGFPRIYVDADVLVTIDVIRALAERLMQGDVFAAAPRPNVDVANCSAPVRAFYRIQSQLPSACEGIGGSGVYALSERGRQRFHSFPAITADDGYVRIQFTPEERVTLQSARSVVFAPHRLKDLIAIKSRSHLGNYELAKLYPQLWRNKGQSNHKALLRLFRSPSLWLDLFVYSFVMTRARWQARNRIRRQDFGWKRDNSSRFGGMSLGQAGKSK
jgi:glycosyltransferase involved in cell wall biosynthesis